jgi:hypothetical protein
MCKRCRFSRDKSFSGPDCIDTNQCGNYVIISDFVAEILSFMCEILENTWQYCWCQMRGFRRSGGVKNHTWHQEPDCVHHSGRKKALFVVTIMIGGLVVIYSGVRTSQISGYERTFACLLRWKHWILLGLLIYVCKIWYIESTVRTFRCYDKI